MRLHPLLSICAVALPLMACGDNEPQTYQGYVEGEYVHIAPPDGGPLASVMVKRGDKVAKDTLLFQMDRSLALAAHEDAQAQVERTRASLNDISKGLRKSELDQIRAARESALANSTKADADLHRAEQLYAGGHISKAALDSAKANARAAHAALQEASAKLTTGELGGRIDQIEAAEAAMKSAEAALHQAEWRLQHREGRAAQAGIVEDIYFRAGETVNSGQAIVSLLPPANVKLRFFIPEPQLGAVKLGDKLLIACDGCAENLTATLSFISSKAEFTPPVIYSEDVKSKLVFMAEAIPDTRPEQFHPGQPVQITLAKSGE